MAEEQPKESANPAGEVIEEVNEPSMSKEEAIALAEQNTKLVRDCLSKDASSFPYWHALRSHSDEWGGIASSFLLLARFSSLDS